MERKVERSSPGRKQRRSSSRLLERERRKMRRTWTGERGQAQEEEEEGKKDGLNRDDLSPSERSALLRCARMLEAFALQTVPLTQGGTMAMEDGDGDLIVMEE